MITILDRGIAGVALARALAVRGYPDVVVFDPRTVDSGSTGKAMGGFRTQFIGKINIELSLASRPFFITRTERIGFQPTGYLYLAEERMAAEKLRWRAEIQVMAGLPITHPDPALLLPFYDTSPVIACGIWSRQVAASLGIQLPVEPREYGVFRVRPKAALPRNFPFTIGLDLRWSLREYEGQLFIKFQGDPHNWEAIRTWLAQRIPAAAVDQPEGHWVGSYEMTPDQHPLVGETARPGVWASCGFSGHGVIHAPAVAENLAAMILGQTPPVDISALSPLRTEPLRDFTQV